jgi:hypothetical protein
VTVVFHVSAMASSQYAPVKRSVLQDTASTVHATVVCIQEMKLRQIDDRLVSEMLGPNFRDIYSLLPSTGPTGTCGGILIAASGNHFKLIASHRTSYTLIVIIHMLR